MVKLIDEKAKNDGLTRQQLLAALIDLGLNRKSTGPDSGVIGAQRTIALLQSTEAVDVAWSYRHLRSALFKHLAALAGP